MLRADCLTHAKISESAQRYDEMLEDMKIVSEMGQGFNTEEQNLLSSAYKYVITPRRYAFRVLATIERSKVQMTSEKIEIIQNMRIKVQEELERLCLEAIKICDIFIKAGPLMGKETKCVYRHIQADHYRLVARDFLGYLKLKHQWGCSFDLGAFLRTP